MSLALYIPDTGLFELNVKFDRKYSTKFMGYDSHDL
jgi:hypothetical protein